jgi:PST family polysaccharide transporter
MATLSYNAFGSITYFLAARHSLRPSLDGQTVRELLFFGGGLTLSRLLQFAATNIDKLILAKVLGHQLLGVYDMAYRVMMLPAKNFGNVIDNVMFPTLANVQHQLPLMRKAFLGVISVISLFYLPLTAFVIVIAEELTLALLGEKWVSIILPLRLLMASSYFRITVRMCDATIRALGAVYQDAVRKLLFLLAITVGVWAGGSAGSINGACIGLGIADAVTYAMMSILCCNLLNLKISQFLIQNLSGLFLATVSGGTAFAALALLGTTSSPPLLSLIIVTATTALTLSALTWVRPDLLGPSGMLLVQRCLNLVKIRHWVFTALREKFAAPINQDTLAS